MTRPHHVLALAVLACAVPLRTAAEPLYSHFRLIAPAAPGGGWDQTARAMQLALQAAGIVGSASVENIPGAAGTIGLAHLMSAERGKGDVAMVSGLIMLGAIVTNNAPVTLRDVTPLARLTGEYEAIVVPAASPYRSLPDLLAAFRARPESIAWAGGSAGGTDQILAGLMADAVGVSPRRVNYVAFAGGGESVAAILGGQVTAGISGLGEFAPQIAAGTIRILAVSSAARLADVDAPTLREHGVDVALENWRSIVGPPGMTEDDRDRLARAIERMVASEAWREALRRYQWNDRFLAGGAFARFVADEEARVRMILDKLGTTTALPQDTGLYPVLVLAGWGVTALVVTIGAVRGRRDGAAPREADTPTTSGSPHLRAMALLGVAMAANLWLIERAGFVLAAIALFWTTARAYEDSHPVRDLALAVVLSLGAYLLFARALRIDLPAGLLAGWL